MTRPKTEWISLVEAMSRLEVGLAPGVNGRATVLQAIKAGRLSVRGVQVQLTDYEIDSAAKPSKPKPRSPPSHFPRNQNDPPLADLDSSMSFSSVDASVIVLGRDSPGLYRSLAFVEVNEKELNLFASKAYVWQDFKTEGRSRVEKNWRALLLTLLSMERSGKLKCEFKNISDFKALVAAESKERVIPDSHQSDLSAVYNLFVLDGGKQYIECTREGFFDIDKALEV